MKLQVKVSDELDYFVKLITILSTVRPIKDLRPKERQLLAYLLFYNNKYKQLDVEERAVLVFSKETRLDICEATGMDQQTFYNNKSQLKIKGILNDDYLTKLFINLYYQTDYNIIFNLKTE